MTNTTNVPRISEQDIQDHVDEILDRVEQGELFCITRDGRPMAMLLPIPVYEEYLRIKKVITPRAHIGSA